MKKAKRIALALIIFAAVLAAAIAVLALLEQSAENVPYTGSRFVMRVYQNIPASGDFAPPRDGSEPFEGNVRALEKEVRYKGFSESERLARNAEGGLI